MNNQENRQPNRSNLSGAELQALAEIDDIDVTPSPELAGGEAPAIGASSPISHQLIEKAQEAAERIKREVAERGWYRQRHAKDDAHRKGDGREEYNKSRREEYWGRVADLEGRTVRSYRGGTRHEAATPERTKAQKQASRARKEAAMTPAELATFKASEAARKRAAYAAKRAAKSVD